MVEEFAEVADSLVVDLEYLGREILPGHPIERRANRETVANPASLDWFAA